MRQARPTTKTVAAQPSVQASNVYAGTGFHLPAA